MTNDEMPVCECCRQDEPVPGTKLCEFCSIEPDPRDVAEWVAFYNLPPEERRARIEAGLRRIFDGDAFMDEMLERWRARWR